MEFTKEQLRNRSHEQHEPMFVKSLRSSTPTTAIHPCFANGHNTVFRSELLRITKGDKVVWLPTDRYGCCTRCGNEMLT